MIKIIRQAFAIAALSLLFSNAIVLAGPPFVTDDPEPVDYKHGEFYLSSTYARDKDETSGTLPLLEFNYGILPNFHFHVITPFAFNNTEEEPTRYGYGDTELGLKIRFIQEGRRMPQAAIFPIVELPSGNEKFGLGNGKAQVFLPLWLQKSWGPWTTYGGGGFWFNPGEGNRNWVLTGWELQRDFSKWLTLGGELFFQSRDEKEGQNRFGFNGGGFLNLSENYHLLFSLGRDFYGPNRISFYAGFQWTF